MSRQILALRDFANSPEMVIRFPTVFSQTLHEITDMYFYLEHESFLFKSLPNNY